MKGNLNLFSNRSLSLLGYFIASEIFIQILEGVNYLHKQIPPIIHGRLNANNILIKLDNRMDAIVKITDLGTVFLYSSEYQSQNRDKTPGSYIAPVNENTTLFNNRVDIYSLGIISQELFSSN